MEKVTLFVKKILALIFSFSLLPLTEKIWDLDPVLLIVPGLPLAFLFFAVLSYKVTGEKPKYLFGLTQSDAHLTKKGGFWNLFKWIVNVLGFIYDILVWVVWGVFLLFLLIVDIIMFVKFVVYWIIHAVIWFIRQLFPPFIFIFRMFMHYIINWFWWIYQMAFRNMKISVNKNFYIIALWGTIPALFIVFLFQAISQFAGIPELVAIGGIFALIPLVWSFGEIAAVRYEERCKDDYTKVKLAFRNGWDSVKSALFYLIIFFGLIIIEIALNLLGWIPNLSMSFLGIALNLNMAISLLLVFLAVIVIFVDSILPTHILYHPEHQNDLKSSLGFLGVIGKKFLRYVVATVPTAFFGAILLLIPVFVMVLTSSITNEIKNGVLDVKIENLQEQADTIGALDAYIVQNKISRLEMYKAMPETASALFGNLGTTSDDIKIIELNLEESDALSVSQKAQFDVNLAEMNIAIEEARIDTTNLELVTMLLSDKQSIEDGQAAWVNNHNVSKEMLQVDLKEQRSVRIQMPILYFFIGILFAVFAGIVLAVFVAYVGNVVYELYSMREDDKPTYWCQTIDELKARDGNQPLLGFTFLAIIGLLIWMFAGGGLNLF
jgi:hypothetical protein